MSAPIDTNDNNIIIIDSNELAERSKGGVEHVSPGDTDSTSASPGNPVMEHAPGDTVPQLDNIGELSDADQVLQSDQVNAAIAGGGIFQSRDYVCSLVGRPQKHGQILVSPIAADPRAGEAVSYHITVSRRYQDLGVMRGDFHLHGKFGAAAISLREAFLRRFYPEIGDHDWRAQSRQIASATNFADYQKKRRLDLIKAEEEEEQSIQGDETLCPYYTWEWSDTSEGPRRFHPAMTPGIYDKYFFRGPYSSDCVWNLADNISPRGEANLLSLLDLGNALRGMSKQDQDLHKFHMARVLSISRLLESRCQSLFEGLIEAQRWARDEAAKKKAARAAKAETDSLLAEAQASLQKATAKLGAIQRQHKEQCEELMDEKSGLLVGLEDEQTLTAELRHEQKAGRPPSPA